MNNTPTCDYCTDPPSYEGFYKSYLLPNRPVIIGPKLIASWPAVKHWVRCSSPSTDGKINWDYLSQNYGDCDVTVADCGTREFSDQKRSTMHFRDVVALWTAVAGENLYVKDWHLTRYLAASGSNGESFYSTPDIFRDDWMNAYYSACTEDDFRFVYVGAAGTFTPLHRDVYTSYSWSTNVCGRKRWWLFPPEQTRYLFRKGGEAHAETAFDVRDVDEREFPDIKRATPIVVEQKDGETIFVPSGWYHQVENLTACISINHNWCNSVNLPSLYDSMCAKVTEVEHALEDVKELLSQNSAGSDGWMREWVQIVQDVVEKDAGWNWTTFWKMVLYALKCTCNEFSSTPQLSMKPHPGASELLWRPAPPHLTPPHHFILDRVKKCYQSFVCREHGEVESIEGLKDVLQAVAERLPETNAAPLS
ncbi:Clavaminate synthase-like protein [Wolfiporia cocos MD-104 SS10]|uniref:Clavaminate synthase-like protein n=1 Tax=Wolfiporia cocos (strain MD-104) TaxID=742152 RepID=A0A2H3JM77_WOLCO|nr:Clavaminate synthase-like protein [Wolfiporia cocos MD-104 SS10]